MTKGRYPRMFPVLALGLTLGAAWLLSQSSTQTTLRNPPPRADVVLLVRLGVTDQAETKWDGSLEVNNGELAGLAGYEMRIGDLIHPPRRWEATSRRAFAFQRRPHDEGFLKDQEIPILAPSFYVYLRGGDATQVKVETAQGGFVFAVGDIPAHDSKTFLDGRLSVMRAPYPILVGRGERGSDRERLTDNDYPSVTVAGDNSTWVAWTGFRYEADRVYAERILPGENAGPRREPHAVSPKGGDVYRTAIAEDSEGKIWVVWSQRVSDNWDLYGRSFDGQSWSSIERLTTASQPDTQHQLVQDSGGRLHLVWQGYRDSRAGIFHREFQAASGWSAETRVSDPSAPNCWEPSLAVDGGGNLYVGWDQYGANGYDVWMRARTGGRWDKPLAVAATARYEAQVSVTADRAGRAWLAWHESGVNWGKDWGYPYDIQANATGLYNSRNLRMAVFEKGRLSQPAQALEDVLPPPGNNFYEYPQLAADGAGNVRAFFRKRTPLQFNVYPRTPSHQALWEIYTSHYDGTKWSEAALVPYSTGRNDMRVSTARDGAGNLVAAWPTDRRGFRDFINALPDVFVGRYAKGGEVSAVKLAAFQAPAASAEPVHANESDDVRRIRDYRYSVNGKTYRIFRGDMHRHTEISWDGYSDGSTEETYRYAVDAAAMDFLAITEHNFGVEDEYDWWRSQKFVDLYRIGNSFVPLFAYERSATYPNGHRNIVFSYRGAPVLDVQHYEWTDNRNYMRQGAERLFGYLRKYKGVAMPHTSATDMGTDWRDYDPEVEPVVEIYQSDRTSYECADCWRAADPKSTAKQFGGYKPDGFVSEAWKKGYRLGVQASSDHLGVHTAYSMILAPELSREALVDAIRQRHTYGATDNIILDFRLVDGAREHLMGDDAKIEGPARFRIHVEGTGPLSDVEIVKDNQMVYSQKPGTKTVDLEYRDSAAPGEEASFYYLRVRQQDKQIGWGSPIWVSRRK